MGVLTLAFLIAGCGGKDTDAGKGAKGKTGGEAASTSNSAAPGGTGARLDAEIERLERSAEKSPGDGEVRAALADAYVKRAAAERAASKLPEALKDYQSALMNDPDNEDAQRGIAEVKPQIEGEKEGEYGEPEPLPITPNVTSGAGEPTPSTKTSPEKPKP